MRSHVRYIKRPWDLTNIQKILTSGERKVRLKRTSLDLSILACRFATLPAGPRTKYMSHTFTIPATVEALLQGLEASEWNFGSDREMANLCQHFLKSFEKATEAKLKDQRVYNRFVPDGNDPGKMYIFSTTSRETDRWARSPLISGSIVIGAHA